LTNQTESEYKLVISSCRSLFEKKTTDYGTAWRIMRLPSITDQILIKAQRIRSIQQKKKQLIDDDINSEFVGIINYCIIALIQMGLNDESPIELGADWVMIRYDEEAKNTLELLLRKNHDYGEAWREMRVSSITDIILMKLHRVKQIEDNEGKTLVSEGLDANYRDMLNYAVFALIQSGFIAQ
jgi:hypothetical protein